VREGFEPDVPEAHNPEAVHNLDYPFKEGEDEASDPDFKPPVNEEAERWETRDYSEDDDRTDRPSPSYGSFSAERNAWNS
jgi:hypothetical protein